MWTVAACDCRDVKQVVYRESRRPHTCRVRDSTVPTTRPARPSSAADRLRSSRYDTLCCLPSIYTDIDSGMHSSRCRRLQKDATARPAVNQMYSKFTGVRLSRLHVQPLVFFPQQLLIVSRLELHLWALRRQLRTELLRLTYTLSYQSWLSRLQQQLNDTVFSHDCCVLYLLCKLSS